MPRLNQILSFIIPVLISMFLGSGIKLVYYELCPILINDLNYPKLGRIYQLLFITLSSISTSLYYSIVFLFKSHHKGFSNHDKMYQSFETLVSKKTIVYIAVDTSGSPKTCEFCDGKIVPLRSRHCLDCKACITGFDHHCVWYSKCISINYTLKVFLQSMSISILSIFIGIIPLFPLVFNHLNLVINLTWNHKILNSIWWDRPWLSWIGGPSYRYIGAIILGYTYYSDILESDSKSTSTRKNQDSIFGKPSLSALMILFFSIVIILVATSMVAITVRNVVFKGLSTVEIERARRFERCGGRVIDGWDPRMKLWIPDGLGMGGGKVILIEPGTPIFDLGPYLNWKQLMGDRVFEWFVPFVISNKSDGFQWPISDKWMKHLQTQKSISEIDKKYSNHVLRK
ncbi:DHHC palmitoyltransferase-domain-containing protein [Phakopsora pachyrhizi]|nr:DHHC palmitoyltransferase-domain-containing protein [Phakopsora pachyrhizi]